MESGNQEHRQPAGGPAVSAIVPCRNEAANVEKCLRSILNQVEPQGGFEVIVADGMSDDGTREVLARMAAADSRLRVVDNPSRTTPCGMNCGIGAARGDWIAIMGSHNRYAPDYLVRCLEVAEETGADNVGGSMVSEGEGRVQRAIAAAHHSPFSVGGARWHNADYEGPADTVFGGFYRRDVFRRIGPFDEELVRNQDDELNLRLTRSGGRVWQSPRVRSWYHPRSSLPALFCQYQQYGYWKVRVIRKHTLPASWRHLVPGAFVFSLGALALATAAALFFSHTALGAFGYFPGVMLAALLAAYMVAVFAASLATARRSGWDLFLLLPAAFACYHVGYGYGFLHGVWDFAIRSRGPGDRFVRLTRPALPAGKSR